MKPARTLVYNFFRLPFYIQMEISQELGLVEEEDNELTDIKLFALIFERANKRKQLEDVWEKVEIAHGREVIEGNPFKGK